MKRIVLFGLFIIVVLLSSCKTETEATCDTGYHEEEGVCVLDETTGQSQYLDKFENHPTINDVMIYNFEHTMPEGEYGKFTDFDVCDSGNIFLRSYDWILLYDMTLDAIVIYDFPVDTNLEYIGYSSTYQTQVVHYNDPFLDQIGVYYLYCDGTFDKHPIEYSSNIEVLYHNDTVIVENTNYGENNITFTPYDMEFNKGTEIVGIFGELFAQTLYLNNEPTRNQAVILLGNELFIPQDGELVSNGDVSNKFSEMMFLEYYILSQNIHAITGFNYEGTSLSDYYLEIYEDDVLIATHNSTISGNAFSISDNFLITHNHQDTFIMAYDGTILGKGKSDDTLINQHGYTAIESSNDNEIIISKDGTEVNRISITLEESVLFNTTVFTRNKGILYSYRYDTGDDVIFYNDQLFITSFFFGEGSDGYSFMTIDEEDNITTHIVENGIKTEYHLQFIDDVLDEIMSGSYVTYPVRNYLHHFQVRYIGSNTFLLLYENRITIYDSNSTELFNGTLFAEKSLRDFQGFGAIDYYLVISEDNELIELYIN